jgi:hypothetical protein
MLNFLRIDKKNLFLLHKSNIFIKFQSYKFFFRKDHLKDDDLISDILENIKDEKKEKIKETQQKTHIESKQDEERNLASCTKDIKSQKIENSLISKNIQADKKQENKEKK